MTSNATNFWSTIAAYCRELAPISGLLLDSIGQTAQAIDRAGYETRSQAPLLNLKRRSLLSPEDEEEEQATDRWDTH